MIINLLIIILIVFFILVKKWTKDKNKIGIHVFWQKKLKKRALKS